MPLSCSLEEALGVGRVALQNFGNRCNSGAGFVWPQCVLDVTIGICLCYQHPLLGRGIFCGFVELDKSYAIQHETFAQTHLA